jgi:TatD DNase family protein
LNFPVIRSHLALTDTHCHLDLEHFDPDRAEVLERAWQAGLTRILLPGIDLASSQKVLALARSHPRLYAAVGVHPNDSLGWQADTAGALRQLLQGSLEDRKIVAIGEVGLDYYWNDAPHKLQRKVLVEQLDLAAQERLPVVLHLRERDDALEGDCALDLLLILQEWVAALRQADNPLVQAPGVLHSFSGSLGTAGAAMQLGFFIGITGPLTFKKADARREVVKSLPLDRILTETDAPYLAPVPQRGRRNEPAFVRHITDKIAEIHNKSPEEIAAITSANAARLFSWGG